MEIIYPPLIARFLTTYSEFKEFANSEDNISTIENMINKIKCLFDEYKCIKLDGRNNCKLELSFFMLVAHFLVIGGYVKDFGIEANQGIIASSSIDSVSVSFQSTPYNNSDFKYQLSLTPYGKEYLWYLSLNRGIMYIN